MSTLRINGKGKWVSGEQARWGYENLALDQKALAAIGFAGTVGYISSVGLPFPTLAAATALIVEIVGSLALLAGFGTRIAAVVLAAFTLVASFFFHNYWGVPADQAFMQQLLFFKNIAVVGGLLALAANGAGAWSLDARSER